MALDPKEAQEKPYSSPSRKILGIGSKRNQKLQAVGLRSIQDAVDQGIGNVQKLFRAYVDRML